MKKSLFFAIVVIMFIVANSFAQQADPCADKDLVGVQIVPRGFDNRLEAENLAAAIINLDLVDPSSGYCIMAASGKSERQLVVKTLVRTIGNDRGQDTLKGQLIRGGVNLGLGQVIPRLPRSMRSTVRQISKQYTREPRITYKTYQVTTETFMWSGKTLLWKGNGSRIIVVKRTYYGYGQPTKEEIVSGGNVRELLPYAQAIALPSADNLEHRADQLMALLTMMDSMQKRNMIIGGSQMARQ